MVTQLLFHLKLIFKFMINEDAFPDDWKKSNVVLINKKERKNSLKTIDL